MKVKIERDGHHWCCWYVWLGGEKISKEYTGYYARKNCIRGLWRWYYRAQQETVLPCKNWKTETREEVENAIRESRVKL